MQTTSRPTVRAVSVLASLALVAALAASIGGDSFADEEVDEHTVWLRFDNLHSLHLRNVIAEHPDLDWSTTAQDLGDEMLNRAWRRIRPWLIDDLEQPRWTATSDGLRYWAVVDGQAWCATFSFASEARELGRPTPAGDCRTVWLVDGTAPPS